MVRILKERKVDKVDVLFDMLAKKLDWDGKSWRRVLTAICMVKFAVSLASILAMVYLFLSNIHVFEAITLQFSEWLSSSIIAFTISLIFVKLVVVTTCILKFVLKENIFDCVSSIYRMHVFHKVTIRFLAKSSA